MHTTPWVHITLVSASLLLLGASAQRNVRCTVAQPACNHTLDDTLPSALFAGLNQANGVSTFEPTLPGTYKWKFEATDLCKTVSSIISGVVRCPPAPEPSATIASSEIIQNSKATLSAQASRAGYDSGVIKSYAWTVLESPATSAYAANIASKTILGTNAVFETATLLVPGSYKFMVAVSDGCSTSFAAVCFQVTCSCGPTANAGATPTLWTNLDSSSVLSSTTATTNFASLASRAGSGTSWKLDGSLSYDFDNGALSYAWDFVSWTSVDPVSIVWTKSTVSAPALRATCSDSFDGTTKVQSCSFVRITQAATPQSSTNATRGDGAGVAFSVSGSTSSSSKTIPFYVDTEDFAEPTTSCKATIKRTNTTSYRVTPYSTTTQTILAVAEQTETLCEIRILQEPTGTGLAQHNALAWLSVSSLRACRGMWTFSLTVTDSCGANSASVDMVKVNVRCNEPPVAVAACNNTQIWTGSSFEQVKLDGRSSYDVDNAIGTLTYTWTFKDVPQGHCPRAHVPCVESFCSDPAGFTTCPEDGYKFGPSAGVPAAEQTCAPTVYPFAQNRNAPTPPNCVSPCQNTGSIGDVTCTYASINPTQHFRYGNAAYFTPTKVGTYHVQLSVFDGCSTSISDVIVRAVCPTVTVSVAYSDGSPGSVEFKAGSQSVSAVRAVVVYDGDASSLNYQWTYTALPQTATLNFGSSTALQTSISASGSGTFSVTLQVNDGCQTKSSSVLIFKVTCNTAPVISSLVLEGGDSSNQVTYTGNNFPAVSVVASGADTDALTYSWTINEQAASSSAGLGAQLSETGGSKLTFTPTSSGVDGLRRYAVTVTASDGCTVSSPRQIVITLICKPGIQPAIGSARQSLVVQYDHASKSFPTERIVSDRTVWAYPSGQKNFQWGVTLFSPSTSTSGSVVTTGLSGTVLDVLNLKPETYGTYQVSLTVNDGCSQASTTAELIATCATEAVATLAQTLFNIEWNSFLGTQGGFAQLEFDGSTSTGAANDVLTYSWSPTGSLSPKAQGASMNTPVVVYTPSTSGSTTFSLTVFNGPCRQSTAARVTVTARCMAVNALIRSSPSGSSSSQLQVSNKWDGTRFPTVCLDGQPSTYVDNGGRSGRRTTLRYQFTMSSAPEGSIFEASTSRQTPSTPYLNTSYATNGYNITKLNSGTAAVLVEQKQWQMITRNDQVGVVAELNTHHYYQAHTCFKPDLPGGYVVSMSVTDGCASSTATAAITASCPATPRISFDGSSTSAGGGSLLGASISGDKFTRITLAARLQTSRDSAETFTYRWVLVSAPPKSAHQNNTVATIANNQALVASFVPDFEGNYVFELMVSDGCNVPVRRTLTIMAACSSTMAILPMTVQPRFIDFTGAGLVAGSKFNLVANVNGNCKARTTRWSFVERTCGATYIPSSRPPPQTPSPVSCIKKFQCKWEPVECEEPSAANPLYVNNNENRSKPNSTEEVTGYVDGQKVTRTIRNPGWPHIIRNPSGQDECTATFKCRHPGVYKMKLTVSDECATKSEFVTITCTCPTKTVARAGADQTSLYQCAGNNKYDFTTVQLAGVGEKQQCNSRGTDCSVPQGCSAPTPAAKCAGFSSTCCPAKECCPAPCPTCPACPACPLCPTSSSSGSAPAASRETIPGSVDAINALIGGGSRSHAGGDGPVPVASPLSYSSGAALIQSEDSVQRAELQAYGVVGPLSIMLVFSVIGNFVLPRVAKRYRIAEQLATDGNF